MEMVSTSISTWIGAAIAAVFLAASLSNAAAQSTGGSVLAPQPSTQVELYRNMEKRYRTATVKRGLSVRPLPVNAHQIDPKYVSAEERGSVDDFMTRNHVAGLLVIKNGEIVLERYGLGETSSDRWTSYSVAKSVTSTLVGAAIKDGKIKNLDDAVTAYIPEMKGSAYDGVTVRNLISMRSGVKWNENYEDPASDVARAPGPPQDPGVDPMVSYLRRLPRAAEPGAKFNYSTGEIDLAGILVSNAVGESLVDYLSDKVWAPYGMERDAVWVSTVPGRQNGGWGLSMTLRDYGRFALFFLGGGRVDKREVLPPGWTKAATTAYTRRAWGDDDYWGYGYLWWPHPDGSYEASGIFGQSIWIDPRENLVVVSSSAWPRASWPEGQTRLAAFQSAVREATRSH
jgi:CubicO group peptidase (beta-lactamase class C family)